MRIFIFFTLLLICFFPLKSQILLYEDYKHQIYDNQVSKIAISHNNRFLAYGVESGGEITVLDLKVNKALHLLNIGSKDNLVHLEFNQEDQLLVGAYSNKNIVIWDLISGKEEKVITSYSGKISEINLSSNGKLMSVIGSLDEIYLYHFPSGELKGTLKNGHTKKIISAQFNQTGNELVSMATDQQLVFWNCNDLRLVRKIELNPMSMDGSSTKVSAMDAGYGSEVVAVAYEETLLDKGGSSMIFKYNIALYDWRTANLIQIIEGNVKKIDQLILSPDNSHILTNNSTLQEERISFWNRESGSFDQKQLINGKINCYSLSSNGNVLAIGYSDDYNKKATYLVIYSISGLEAEKSYALQKSVTNLSSANNVISTEKPVYSKAFLGDLTEAGKYYALIIGVNNYEDDIISDLEEPVKDAKNLYNILCKTYTFNPDNIVFLEDPKRYDIIAALDQFESIVTENDNLLVFYAGHGHWDEKTQKGYWLPSDARQNNTANWFRNSTLSGYMNSIKSKHTLLIADACFSGSIFKTRDAFGNMDQGVERLYKLQSRKAMTSGTLTVVPDKSVFLSYLTKRLNENEEKYMSSEQLFFSFKTAVLNNSQNIPQFGEISNTGDEGGDFIFIRRESK